MLRYDESNAGGRIFFECSRQTLIAIDILESPSNVSLKDPKEIWTEARCKVVDRPLRRSKKRVGEIDRAERTIRFILERFYRHRRHPSWDLKDPSLYASLSQP